MSKVRDKDKGSLYIYNREILAKMERVKTGIKGFDSLMQGGFVKNSIALVVGAPGTGKTIFGLEYLYRGAKKFDERGIYVTFEQSIKELEEQASQFGWDLKKLQKKNRIKILFIPIEKIHKETLDLISKLVKEFKAKRLVVDSLSTLAVSAPKYIEESRMTNDYVARFFIYRFIHQLKKLDCTTLLTSELKQETWLSRDLLAEFIVDTVILLRYFGAVGESSRTLAIKKARQTRFNEFIHAFKFTKKGIELEKTKKLSFVK